MFLYAPEYHEPNRKSLILEPLMPRMSNSIREKFPTTNLGVRSSNLFGRAILPALLAPLSDLTLFVAAFASARQALAERVANRTTIKQTAANLARPRQLSTASRIFTTAPLCLAQLFPVHPLATGGDARTAVLRRRSRRGAAEIGVGRRAPGCDRWSDEAGGRCDEKGGTSEDSHWHHVLPNR